MGQFTPRANLYLPGGGSTGTITPDETADIDKLNDNFRRIDELLGAKVVPSAGVIPPSMDGQLFYSQDDDALYIWDPEVSQAIIPRARGMEFRVGTAAERDGYKSTATEGTYWRDTDAPYFLYTKRGTEWEPISGTNTYTPTIVGYESGWVPSVTAQYSVDGAVVTVDASTTVDRTFNRITGGMTISLPPNLSVKSSAGNPLDGSGYLLDVATGRFYNVRLRGATGTTAAIETERADATASYRIPVQQTGIAAASNTRWRLQFSYFTR